MSERIKANVKLVFHLVSSISPCSPYAISDEGSL